MLRRAAALYRATVTQYRTLERRFGTLPAPWHPWITAMSERKPPPPAGPRLPPPDLPRTGRPMTAREAEARRTVPKFGAATDGWDAYNDWLGRVRQQTPPSRQAVISKSLYSIASYKSWAEKARDSFDKTK